MNKQIAFLEGFAWAVPEAFAPAIAACCFSPGDLLYDSPKAYEGCWGDARKHLRYFLQVSSSTGVGAVGTGGGDESDVFDQNWHSGIEITLTSKQSGEVRQVRTTQGHVYTLLWRGMPPDANWDALAIRKPLRTAEAHQVLEKVSEKCVELSGARDRTHFLIAHDPVNPISALKVRKVREVLQEKFSCRETSSLPSEVNVPASGDYAPTIRFEIFTLKGDRVAVHDALKSVLYVPTKNKKTDRVAFKLRSHGLLV